MAEREPTETSPLLAGPLGSLEAGDSPNGALPNNDAFANGHSYATWKHIENVDRHQDGVQEGLQDPERAHQGMPEVRKQLKYFLPAIAVGVGDNQHMRSHLPVS